MSQDYVDIVKFKYTSYLKNEIKNSENDDLKSNRLNGELFLPIQTGEGAYLLTGLSYDQLQLDYHGTMDEQIKLTTLTGQIGIQRKLNEKWTGLFLLITRIKSDWHEVNKEHYQYGGIALFTLVKSTQLKWKFGLYFNREFFGNFIMPLVGIDWKVTDRLQCFGVLPGSLTIQYSLHSKVKAGIQYASITGSYHLGDLGQQFYLREGDSFWGHLQLKIFVNYAFTENLVVFGNFGHSLWRRYDLYTVQKELLIHPLYRPISNDPLIEMGVSFRVYTRDKAD